MVEMPTREEKCLESVLCSKYDGNCTDKFHSDCNAAMGASFLTREIRRDPTSGRAELEADTRYVAMVLRDLGLEEGNTSCNSCCQTSECGRTLVAGRCDNTYLSLVQTCRSMHWHEGMQKSHDEGLGGTETCWSPLARATGWSDHV